MIQFTDCFDSVNSITAWLQERCILGAEACRRANILGFERRRPTISGFRYPSSCLRAIGRSSNRVRKAGEVQDKGEYQIYIAWHISPRSHMGISDNLTDYTAYWLANPTFSRFLLVIWHRTRRPNIPKRPLPRSLQCHLSKNSKFNQIEHFFSSSGVRRSIGCYT